MIYFIGSRWRGGDPKWGIGPLSSILWETCPEPLTCIHACDEGLDQHELDRRVLTACREGTVLIEYGARNPSPQAMQELALRCRVVSIWTDSHTTDERALLGFPVSLDGGKFWCKPCPRNIPHEETTRDIDVLFSGEITGERLQINALRSLPINAVIREGWWSADALPEEEYIALSRRAKIVVNFSRARNTAGEVHQFKGRTCDSFYTGAMLLESANPVTRRWFTPGIHYTEFDGDLPERVMYYLQHEAQRAEIAKAGEKRMRAWGLQYWPALLSASQAESIRVAA